MRALLIILLIYLIFRLFTRTLLPYFVRNYVKKAQEKFYQQNPNINPEEAKQREGEVKVKSRPKNQSGSKEELGDYVDFEEVEE
jgi:hypothetical protein